VAGGQILAFPIDFDRRPYNTRTTVRVCDFHFLSAAIYYVNSLTLKYL